MAAFTTVTQISEIRARLVGARNLFAISELYHENSKIVASASGISQSAESILVAPSGFKRYQYAQQTGLPAPGGSREAAGVLSAIVDRRSCRTYSGAQLRLDAVSDLLFHSLGMLDRVYYHRCTPSAGGLYPLELYLISINVQGLAPGLYHYDVRSHAVSHLERGDLRPRLLKAIFIEEAVQTASAIIVLSGVFARSKIKYGERAYRFTLLEAGHVMQNICLAGTVLRLGMCPVGGFVDDHLNDLLAVDGIDEAALYAVTIGIPT